MKHPIGSDGRHEVAVLISSHTRVYAGWIDIRNLQCESLWHIRQCRHIRYWGTKEGVAELAIKGPNEDSKIDQVCDVLVLNQVRVIRPLTDVAIKAWGMTGE